MISKIYVCDECKAEVKTIWAGVDFDSSNGNYGIKIVKDSKNWDNEIYHFCSFQCFIKWIANKIDGEKTNG